MTLVAVLALVVAAANTSVSVLARRFAKAKGWFWQAQFAGFVFRFCTILGIAGWVWRWRKHAAEVAVFILVAAVGQLVGQSYLFLRKPYA